MHVCTESCKCMFILYMGVRTGVDTGDKCPPPNFAKLKLMSEMHVNLGNVYNKCV